MCSCGGSRPAPPRNTAVANCPDRPWDVACILDVFCNGDADDRAVVGKLPRLTVRKRKAKQVHYKKYKGGAWVNDGFTSGGSARGSEVWINDSQTCANAASTLFHEVRHTDQPAGMAGSQREYDAYIETERWRIKKGLPAHHPSFRRTVNGNTVPDEAAIKTYVDRAYAYNPPTPLGGGAPPPRVLGLAANGTDVRLSDGTTRPPREGDAYRLPDTGGQVIEEIPAAQWQCP